MSLKEPDPIPLLPGEQAAGFSVQTLAYPQKFELPSLSAPTPVQYERAVALSIDDANRLRRTHNDSYIHEIFRDGVWARGDVFDTLDLVVASRIHEAFRRQQTIP